MASMRSCINPYWQTWFSVDLDSRSEQYIYDHWFVTDSNNVQNLSSTPHYNFSNKNENITTSYKLQLLILIM